MTEPADSRLKAREGSVLDGKWTLERLLGSGGMAAVYAARHRNGARAAVKILHPELARNQEVRERFLREGYASNQVEHPGAVRVLDDDVVADGADKGTAYIVMELLEGESLQDRVERGPPLGELELLRIVESVLEVLDAAHARGVVHRDLKPENLFLARSENDPPGPATVKILDFGLARLLQNQSITSHGLALGTPSFMSPEQAAGRVDEIDGRTDLFAVGATCFRLRSGRRIHEADNPVELVTKMANLPAPRLAMVVPDASVPFARVIDHALEFKKEDRYETAAAMLKDARRAVAQLEAGADATALSIPSSSLPTPPRDTKARAAAPPAATVELSGRDLEVVRPEESESIHIPKRRSIFPWLLGAALLAALGIGSRGWWPAIAARIAAARGAPSAPATAAQTTVAVPTVRIDAWDAAAAAPADAAPAPSASPAPAPSAAASARAPAATSAAPTASHARPPAKASPANVVKPAKKKPHARKTTPSH